MTNKNDGINPPPQQNITVRSEYNMEYFFALFIEYTIMGRHIETYLILPSKEACQIAIRDNEDMHLYFGADDDVNMWCLETGVLSQSIRPVLRPQAQSEAYH